MFNNNRVYKLAEFFESVQGEFPYTGFRTTFIRFNKCNYHCIFADGSQCDTMYKPHVIDTIDIPYSKIKNSALKTGFITFTGGEPLLFIDEINEILTSLLEDGVYIHKTTIETNGAFLNKVYDIYDTIIPYFKSNINNRFNIIWSPKFLDKKAISTIFTNLYEFYDPNYMYVKIVAVPDWRNLIEDYIKQFLDLFGKKQKHKLALMVLTDNNNEIVKDSVKMALEFSKKYNINISKRIHHELKIQ